MSASVDEVLKHAAEQPDGVKAMVVGTAQGKLVLTGLTGKGARREFGSGRALWVALMERCGVSTDHLEAEVVIEGGKKLKATMHLAGQSSRSKPSIDLVPTS